MTKAKTTRTTTTEGADHDVKTTTDTMTTHTPLRRTDAALRPATPLEILVSRAIDQELEWYFSYAESALHRESVGMPPSYAVMPILATEPTEEAFRARALDIAGAVKRCLLAVRGKHAEILRAAYTPRAWPKALEKDFEGVTAIAVRLAFADDPWPQRPSRTGLEQAAAARLAACIKSRSVPVGRLRSQAQRLLGGAIVAYAGLRALDGSALGVG
jgi:hypothetical protein